MRRMRHRGGVKGALAAAVLIGCASAEPRSDARPDVVEEPMTKTAEAPAEVSPPPAPAASASTSGAPGPEANPVAQEPSAEQLAELGPGVRVLPFAPGRYAGDVDKRVAATHARNWYRENMRTSFVLEFAGDGGVHGCRGQRSSSSNDGPTVHRAERRRQQQGYRGTWTLQADGWIAVELGLDDSVCKQERVYSNLAPSPWQLRCLLVQAGERPPMLACQLRNGATHTYRESHAHLVPGVLKGDWLLLGPGDGLRVEWRSDSVDGFDEGKVKIVATTERVEHDTWSRE